MRFGFSPTQSRARFDAMCAQASLAEALGFDVIWAHEHHSGGSTYPSPLMTLAALAGVTTRIELGTNMLLLPLHHPLRVAEDAAMVDVMSGGRLRLGVSAGYSPADLEAFAVPPGLRAQRMREGLALIRAVWSGAPVSLDSELCRLHDFTLHPKPIRQPPIYIGGSVNAAIRRAARLGDELIISATQRISDVPRILAVYAEALRALDQQPEAKGPTLNRVVHVCPTARPNRVPWRSSPRGSSVPTTPGDTRTSPVLMPRRVRSNKRTPNTSSSARRLSASTPSNAIGHSASGK